MIRSHVPDGGGDNEEGAEEFRRTGDGDIEPATDRAEAESDKKTNQTLHSEMIVTPALP